MIFRTEHAAGEGFSTVRDTVGAPTRVQRGRNVRSIFRKASSFPVLLSVFLIAGAVAGARVRVADSDMWWHIGIGRDILTTHQVPTTEKYSYIAYGVQYGNDSIAME